MCFAGSLQGCLLLPSLFVLYTNDCQGMFESRFIIKFVDDSVIVNLWTRRWTLVQSWTISSSSVMIHICNSTHIDFYRNPPVTVLTLISGMAVETVRYLGTPLLDDRMTFDDDTNSI